MLNYEELEEIIEEITAKITLANRTGELEFFIKSFGLDKNRFEFCLDYNKAKTYPYKKLRYNPDYRVIILGAVPHSSTGKNDSSSVIAEMKNHEGYPRVEVLSGNNEVKITKSNFKEAVHRLMCENYI